MGRISSASRSSCIGATYGWPVSTVTSIRSACATAATKSEDAGRAPPMRPLTCVQTVARRPADRWSSRPARA